MQEKWAAELRASDYALLNGHSLVAIWGALESCVEDTVVAILRERPEVRERLAKSNLQVRTSAFEVTDDDGLRKLYRSLEDAVRVKRDVVATQENLLRLFGLDVGVPEERETLLLANSLRNCLVHRGGVIDEKSVQQTPLLQGMVGQQAHVSRELYLRCHKAVSEVLIRLSRAVIYSPYFVVADARCSTGPAGRQFE